MRRDGEVDEEVVEGAHRVTSLKDLADDIRVSVALAALIEAKPQESIDLFRFFFSLEQMRAKVLAELLVRLGRASKAPNSGMFGQKVCFPKFVERRVGLLLGKITRCANYEDNKGLLKMEESD
jgi:hypothetical protein